MTHDEMETLVGFLKGAFPNLTEDQIEMYSAMLMSEDAELASKAILSGVNDWRFPPSWAEIKERIRPLQRAGAIPRERVPEAPVSTEVPFWVRRWVVARFVQSPPDMRPFREEYPKSAARGEEPTGGWMPGDAYVPEAEQISDSMVRKALAVGEPSPSMGELLGGPE